MHIDSTEFGEITIDGKKYFQVLIVGGAVSEREYARLTDLFGTSHRIGDWEVESLLRNGPELVIIGTGQEGMLRVDEGIGRKLRASGAEVKAMLTPEAVRLFNEETAEGRKVNALIHTTC